MSAKNHERLRGPVPKQARSRQTLSRLLDAAESVLREPLAHRGPAVIQAVVDANEPPMPGQVTTEQALKFAEAMLKGQKEGGKILKTVLEDKLREVV